jgi:hypothetical protein
MGFLLTMPATDLHAFRVLAAEFFIFLDGPTYGSVVAKGTLYEAINFGHAQNLFLLKLR